VVRGLAKLVGVTEQLRRARAVDTGHSLEFKKHQGLSHLTVLLTVFSMAEK
jgi:hypothetical protein